MTYEDKIKQTVDSLLNVPRSSQKYYYHTKERSQELSVRKVGLYDGSGRVLLIFFTLFCLVLFCFAFVVRVSRLEVEEISGMSKHVCRRLETFSEVPE